MRGRDRENVHSPSTRPCESFLRVSVAQDERFPPVSKGNYQQDAIEQERPYGPHTSIFVPPPSSDSTPCRGSSALCTRHLRQAAGRTRSGPERSKVCIPTIARTLRRLTDRLNWSWACTNRKNPSRVSNLARALVAGNDGLSRRRVFR